MPPLAIKSVLRYDEAGALHEADANVEAVEAALLRLDDQSRTSLVVERGAPEALQEVLTIHGHGAGALVCCWTRRTEHDVELERWLLGSGTAEGEMKLKVWGEDTRLPARYGVSAEAARSCVRSFLAREDLNEHGAWEDRL